MEKGELEQSDLSGAAWGLFWKLPGRVYYKTTISKGVSSMAPDALFSVGNAGLMPFVQKMLLLTCGAICEQLRE